MHAPALSRARRCITAAFVISGALAALVPASASAVRSPTATLRDPNAVAGAVVVDEFRLRGPNGSTDEYIELHNTTTHAINLNDSTLETWWTLTYYSSVKNAWFDLVFGSDTTIPPKGRLLVTNESNDVPCPLGADFCNPSPNDDYSLEAYYGGDVPYDLRNILGDPNHDSGGDIPDQTGVVLYGDVDLDLGGRESGLVIDKAGFGATGPSGDVDNVFEGTALTPIGASTGQYAWVRKTWTENAAGWTVGQPSRVSWPKDSDSNNDDFVFVANDHGSYGGVGALHGGPGPQGLLANYSPPHANKLARIRLLDEGKTMAQLPNHEVKTGEVDSGPFGTLYMRRVIKNASSSNITQLRIRITELSTWNSPTFSANQAKLRLLSSPGGNPFTLTDGSTVTSAHAILDPISADAARNYPNGGGVNTTLRVPLPAGDPLTPGEELPLELRFAIDAKGQYRILTNIEAVTS